MTDGSAEWICIAKEDWGYTDESCLQQTVVPSDDYLESLSKSERGGFQVTAIANSIGCYACDTDLYVPVIESEMRDEYEEAIVSSEGTNSY